MYTERDEVPLSQIPDSYQLASPLPFSSKRARVNFYFYFIFTLVWITLAGFNLLGDRAFQGRFPNIIGFCSFLIVCFTFTSVPNIHGLIQRWMSRLRGYVVRFDPFQFFFFSEPPYLAVPGQFISRENCLLIVVSPFVLFLLLLLPLPFLPSGIVGSVLVYIVVVNLLGSTYDLYLFWRFCTMSRSTVIYVESLMNFLVLEPASSGVFGEHEQDLISMPLPIQAIDLPVPPAWPWVEASSPGATRKKEILPEDEDILIQAYSVYAPTKFNAWFIAWTTRMRSNDAFELATNAVAKLSIIMSFLVYTLDEEGEGILIDVKFSEDEAGELVSLDDTQLAESEGKAEEIIENAQLCEIKCIVRSGLWNLYPVIVKVRLQRMTQEQTHIEIKGITKKFWIKQSTAEQAVRIVTQWCELAQDS